MKEKNYSQEGGGGGGVEGREGRSRVTIRSKNKKIPVFPLTRPTLFFVPTLQFLLHSRKKQQQKTKKNKKTKNKKNNKQQIFIPTDPKIFQKN